MISVTIEVKRPIVATILKSANKRREGSAAWHAAERAIAIPKGIYKMTRILGKNIIHVQSASTYEKYNAFIDDYKMLRESNSLEVVAIHR